ncbi:MULTISPECIES: hypothetical protein [Neisseria]|jgi:toxin-antitoxin system, toxin component, PIN family|uniref:hypothetical protein n=1 Tax=Neisseria TaxID=482 RepID=UPI000665AC4C|nr:MULTISPECIES: hypothetical protein [Neisseria]OFL95307.1 toxin PIN [Neisseria sp. HMSC074B07]
MLIDKKNPVSTVKIPSIVIPAEEDYPHYRLIPVQTEAGNDMCLLFYVNEEYYLILEPRIKRYLALRKLEQLTETAPFKVFEVMREAE